MASRIVSSSPWPQQTPHYTSSNHPTALPYSVKTYSYLLSPSDENDPGHDSDNYDNQAYRQAYRYHKHSPPSRRQAADPATVTSDSCGLVPNDVITCFPSADSEVVQGIPSRVVWNQKLPIFSQTQSIDIYLFHGDTDVQVTSWLAQPYPQGHLAFIPDDIWWGPRGPEIPMGKNQTQPFFFVLVPNGTNALNGVSQATFTATQTSLPTSILVSLASASSSSASLASASSASLASLASLSSSSKSASPSTIPGSATTLNPTSASLQGNSSNSNNFPNWAIALLAVFGFLAFLSLLCVLFLLFRGLKRRERGTYERASNGGELKYRGSVGSNTPMIPRTTTDAEAAFRDGPATGASLGGATAGGAGGSNAGPSLIPSGAVAGHPMSDNGSTISHTDSAYAAGAPPLSHSGAHPPPFSLTDATALGLAFRNVMRKPEFLDVDENDADSPNIRDSAAEDDAGREVLESELAEEGRDIRSVSSSRGVKVETVDSSTA